MRLFFWNQCFGVKSLRMTEIAGTKSQHFQNWFWLWNSSNFSYGKAGLLWIFGLQMTNLQVLCHFGFWGPSAYEFVKFDENIWLACMATLRTTYLWRVIWNLPHPELHYPPVTPSSSAVTVVENHRVAGGIQYIFTHK